MVYRARIKTTGKWDLEDSNGTVIWQDRSLPVDESDDTLWEQIITYASQENDFPEAVATVATGLVVIDER